MAHEEHNVAGAGNKSKQERIRDNQRRSRARRQEHLADLEKRLSECHATCRDAELQKQAFKDLQVENSRLRELLSLAGVDSTLVESYVYQSISHAQSTGDPAHRHIRPKISMDARESVAPVFNSSMVSSRSSASPFSDTKSFTPLQFDNDPTRLPAASGFTMQPLYTQSMLRMPGPCGTSCSSAGSAPRTAQSYSAYAEKGQLIKSEPKPSSSFCCDSFLVEPNGPLHDSPENTILCSVAKDMIDQYIINSEDMDRIKARLATGFCKPQFPGQGCRVNNQLLFEVLNDISSRLS